jgi:UDP-glucose 4-epimerase
MIEPSGHDPGSFKGTTRWLVTGGCGFIGTNLIKRLITDNTHTIRVIDNLSVGRREDLADVCDFRETDLDKLRPVNAGDRSFYSSAGNPTRPVELIVGDIQDNKLASLVTEGMDVIVHLAARTGVGTSVKDPRSDCMTNFIGTLNYLEAARENRITRFVFASSGAAIGECEPPIHEEFAPHPVSPYGAGKLAGEAYCSAYYHTFGVETVALRFSNVYGPGSAHKESVVARFIRNAVKGEILEIYGDGKQTRDFIYIDDLVRAILLSTIVKGIGGEIFHVATNRETTIAELVERLMPILAEQGINRVQIRHKGPRKGDVLRTFSDVSKAKEVLGWKSMMDIADGLRHTVLYFKNLKN